MLSVLGYEFFRNALIAGLLASIACGVIGTYVVVKRMVAISGGISHAAFGGIGLGYYLGIDPIAGAVLFTVGAALGMGMLQFRARQQIDTLIGAVWAAGMAIGVLFVSITPGFAPDLFSYLFGNILLVPAGDIRLMALLAAVILLVVAVLYQELLAATFDEEYAAIMNLPVERLVLLLLALIALTVVMLIRVVGIILVIALLTLPAAISRQYTSRLKAMMLISVFLGIAFTMGGIWLSYLLDIPSGATIILIGSAAYAASLVHTHMGRIR
ncbi:MAG: metal ABC transporter permease [Methanomicrobiaceae archaeon]|nr:metal ABC transporter permease [Methanomicrobiaceae archaeon]MDD5419899.1 metal ABC transporter permease [Methanomicrobiaceae archaeon]